MTDNLIQLGLMFKQQRRKRNYTQGELAIQLKCSQATIAALEKGAGSKEVTESRYLDLIALPPKPEPPKVVYHSEYLKGLKDARRALINQSNFLTKVIRHAEAGKPIAQFLEEN